MWFKKKKHKEPLIVNVDGTEKEIYNYTVTEEFYPAGEYIDNRYVSVYWGLSFSADDKWRFITDEQLRRLSKRKQEDRSDELLGALEMLGADTEWIRGSIENLYVEVEMCALYVENGKVLGDVQFMIRDNWPDDDETAFEYAEKSSSVMRQIGKDVTCGEKRLGGEKFAMVSGVVCDEKSSMLFKQYVARKKSMLLEIFCRALPGCEYVFDAFEKHLKKV